MEAVAQQDTAPPIVVPIVVPIYDTLIVSDLHLGADMSRAREALRILQENQYRRLILLGDIFADLNFGRLKKEHWKFLGFIRKLSNPKRRVEVVWVEGKMNFVGRSTNTPIERCLRCR
jgi:metallophosphoesterase superfamily enzyme